MIFLFLGVKFGTSLGARFPHVIRLDQGGEFAPLDLNHGA
jgi:hypothetical protein